MLAYCGRLLRPHCALTVRTGVALATRLTVPNRSAQVHGLLWSGRFPLAFASASVMY